MCAPLSVVSVPASVSLSPLPLCPSVALLLPPLRAPVGQATSTALLLKILRVQFGTHGAPSAQDGADGLRSCRAFVRQHADGSSEQDCEAEQARRPRPPTASRLRRLRIRAQARGVCHRVCIRMSTGLHTLTYACTPYANGRAYPAVLV